MFCMSPSDVLALRAQYPSAMDGDDAFDFVVQMIEQELEATRRMYPDATATIRHMEHALPVIQTMAADYSGWNFEEET